MAEQQIGANKEEAERLRLKTYHGTPCEKGHTKRYTKGGKCFECSAEALRRNRKKAKAAKTGKVTKGRAVVATEKPTSGWEGLARRARALIEKADNAAEKAEQFYKSAGLTIKEIKDKFPKQWEAIVRDEIHIGRSRAYELMLIADGKATLATIRQRTNERQKALKAKSSVITDRPAVSPAPRSLREAILYGGLGHEETPPPRAESAEVDIKQHQAEMEALDQSDEDENEDLKPWKSHNALNQFTHACKTYPREMIEADLSKAMDVAINAIQRAVANLKAAKSEAGEDEAA